MRKILTILLFAPLLAAGTNYTWNSATTNIVISDAGAFGNLNAGDTVFIPVRSGGYRSYSITNVNSGTPGSFIIVYWQPGAYITPSASNLFADILDNAFYVRTIGLKKEGHKDAFRHGTTAHSHGLEWIGCDFTNSNGFGPVFTGALPNFDGTLAKSFYAWKFENCDFDSLLAGGSGGCAIQTGGNFNAFPPARYNFWFNLTITNCRFKNFSSSGAGGTSNFLQIWNSYGTTITNNTYENLGVVANPTGHAALINWYSSHGIIANNTAGPNNFGNVVRGKFADCPTMGAAYTGLTKIYNNVTKNQRKYPVFEVQANDTTGFGGGYARSRNDSTPLFYNNTAYNLAVGVGNSPYIAAMIDDYLQNARVTAKNNVFIMVRDTTCSPNIWVQGIVAASATGITYDTASNRFSCSWVGFADSTVFTPSAGGILNNTGVAVPAWLTTDIAGNPRSQGSNPDIGAVERSAAVIRKQLPLLFFTKK